MLASVVEPRVFLLMHFKLYLVCELLRWAVMSVFSQVFVDLRWCLWAFLHNAVQVYRRL